MVVGASASAAPPAGWKYPPNRLSPQFKSGNCIYRIRYGNFGSVAYAQVRYYTNRNYTPPRACRGADLAVRAQRGWIVKYTGAGPKVIRGRDSCGRYIEFQATSDWNPSIGVGMYVWFRQHMYPTEFHHDGENAVRPHRVC